MKNSPDGKESKYKCEKCRDLTFIIDDDVAISCECRAIKLAMENIKRSGISEEYRSKRFNNFDYSRDIQVLEAYRCALGYVKSFVDTECSRGNSIMFMGQVGSGKTHLSLAIANELIDKGIGVIYMAYREVITKIKQNIMDDVYYHKVVNRYKNARVLLIDDLFKGSVTGSDINIMFEIINHRYFHNLPMIVSGESGVNRLLDIDEALGSRIIEMCKGSMVDFKGKRLNYRIYRD